MKHLSLDLETYSSVDIGKSGVYKYAEAPDFEILLLGYSVDGGDVHVVDLTQGEIVPAEIIDALEDEHVQKWAFNANFERVCLSRYLGYPQENYLSPEGWHCTMVWAAYLGLPLSLQAVGQALDLDKQKLSEGKELIHYFCQPDHDGRRKRPEDAPDKWTLFKAYNKRDVEVEQAIQEKFKKFPVPETIWVEYHLDQEINDRGIRVDTQLVSSAIAMDARSNEELTQKMQELTMLDNPNSVAQMKKLACR